MKLNLKEVAQNKKAQKIAAIVCGGIIGVSSILGVAGIGIALANKNDPLASDVARTKIAKIVTNFASKYNEEKFADLTVTQVKHSVYPDYNNPEGQEVMDENWVTSINNDGNGLYTICLNYSKTIVLGNGDKHEENATYTLGHYLWAGETEEKYYIVSETTYDGETDKNAVLVEQEKYVQWVEGFQDDLFENIWERGYCDEDVMMYLNPVYRQSGKKLKFNGGNVYNSYSSPFVVCSNKVYGEFTKGMPTYACASYSNGKHFGELKTYISYSSNAKLADMKTIGCEIEGTVNQYDHYYYMENCLIGGLFGIFVS